MRENLKHPHNEIPVMLFVLKSFAVKVWQLNAATEKSWIKKYNTLKVNNKHLHNRDCLKSSTHSELVELFANVRHQKPIYRLFFSQFRQVEWQTVSEDVAHLRKRSDIHLYSFLSKLWKNAYKLVFKGHL